MKAGLGPWDEGTETYQARLDESSSERRLSGRRASPSEARRFFGVWRGSGGAVGTVELMGIMGSSHHGVRYTGTCTYANVWFGYGNVC